MAYSRDVPSPTPKVVGPLKLVIPLDASKIEGFKPEQPVQVLVVTRKGETRSEQVRLDEKGAGAATFEFREAPDGLKVLVGPHDATAEEMQRSRGTISLDVPARSLQEKEIKLPPIFSRLSIGNWWLSWCSTFTIRGQVRCADGSPGARSTVSARLTWIGGGGG